MLSILQRRPCVKKIVFALSLLGLAGCQMAEDAVDSGIALARDCGVDNLEDVASLGTISDDCKMALLELLPDFEDNLSGALVPLGSETFDGKPVVFFAAANAEGLPLTLDEAEQLKVTAISEDAETVLDASQYVPKGMALDWMRCRTHKYTIVWTGSIIDRERAWRFTHPMRFCPKKQDLFQPKPKLHLRVESAKLIRGR